eukprot:CAMPEP_0114498716 /NCGR_PEP_ID=MMETSP0109-20121206/7022_1 /TAXON_ID=29199 /ORGANISM="Chlorarachnion reptans, Strain CCCM449" /LENGTH=163 /DNA_ID=CAMNT_0001676215 /DNA_START=157 /DNA_END=648 /DNA_ORIENTATION=+
MRATTSFSPYFGARISRHRMDMTAERRSPYDSKPPSGSESGSRRSPYASAPAKQAAPPKTSPFDSYTPAKKSPFESFQSDVVQTSRFEDDGSSKDPEGFWENTARYIRYFFSVNFGIIISIVVSIITAVFKNPWVLVALGLSGAGLYVTVKSMLGMDGVDPYY